MSGSSSLGVRRWSLLGVMMIGACAPAHRATPPEPGARYAQILDSLDAEAVASGELSRKVPRISVYVPSAGVASSQYLEPAVRVTDDAYVMVVAIDLDRRVRVLFPESPADNGFIARPGALRLGRFFAGFGRSTGAAGYAASFASLNYSTERLSRFGGAGALIAIASDRPLQFDRLVDDGEWDERAIAELVFDGSATMAANQLGRAVSLTGQQFSTDYDRFYGGNRGAFGSLALGGFACSFGYVMTSASTYLETIPTARFFVRDGITYATYQSIDECGRASYSVPIPLGPVTRPRSPQDSTRTDSTMTNPLRGHRVAEALEGSTERHGGLRFRAREETTGDAVTGVRMKVPSPGIDRGYRPEVPREAEQTPMRPRVETTSDTAPIPIKSGPVAPTPMPAAPAPSLPAPVPSP